MGDNSSKRNDIKTVSFSDSDRVQIKISRYGVKYKGEQSYVK